MDSFDITQIAYYFSNWFWQFFYESWSGNNICFFNHFRLLSDVDDFKFIASIEFSFAEAFQILDCLH